MFYVSLCVEITRRAISIKQEKNSSLLSRFSFTQRPDIVKGFKEVNGRCSGFRLDGYAYYLVHVSDFTQIYSFN